MNRIAPRILAAAVVATFALAGCGREDNRAASANQPGSATVATGGTASSPTTPGATPGPSGGGSAISGGGAAPSGSSGASATTGTSSPAGTTAGTTASETGAPRPGTTPSAGTGTTGTTGPGSTGAASGSDTTGSGTGGSGSSTMPGKSSSLDSTAVPAHVLPTADSSAAGRALSRSDRTFVEEAASGGLAEVEAGRMMSERATLPTVKQFAAQLVKDHTQANEELRRIAANYGVSLPATPEAKHRAMVEKLASERGPDLDREFIRTFGVREHEKDIQDFRKQAQSGDNAELKAFAAKTLPKLQEHQAMAQRLEQALARK